MSLITPKNKINIPSNQKVLPSNMLNNHSLLMINSNDKNKKIKNEKNLILDSINNINENQGKNKNNYFEILKDKIFSPENTLKPESKNQKIFSEISKKLKNIKNNININLFLSSKNKKNEKKEIKYLPEKNIYFKNKKTLFLDLDETLVHSSFKSFNNKEEIIFDMLFEEKKHTIHVLKRPFVDEFLNQMSNLFEIVIFTASISDYANPLLNKLDINNKISFRLFREHCTSSGNFFIKDLRKVNRNLKDVILIDNNPISYLYNKDNGIPILTWHSIKSDNELIKLIPLLEYLSQCDDVRNVIKKVINGNFINYHEVNKLLNNNKNKENIKENNINNFNSNNKDFFGLGNILSQRNNKSLFNNTVNNNNKDNNNNNTENKNDNVIKYKFSSYYFNPHERNSIRENLNDLEPRKSNNLFDDKIYSEKYNTFYNPKTTSVIEKKYGENFIKSIFDKGKKKDSIISSNYSNSSSKSSSVKKVMKKNYYNKLIDMNEKKKNKEEKEKLDSFHRNNPSLINNNININPITLPSRSVEKNIFSFNKSKFHESKINAFNSKISNGKNDKLNIERNKTFESFSFLSINKNNNVKTNRNNSNIFKDRYQSNSGNYSFLKSNFFS